MAVIQVFLNHWISNFWIQVKCFNNITINETFWCYRDALPKKLQYLTITNPLTTNHHISFFFVFSQRIWNAKCTIPTKCVINILMSTTHISILNWGLWSPISLTSHILMREGFFSFVFFYRRGKTRQNQKEEKVLNLSLFYVTINVICYITFMSKQQDLYYIFELSTLSWTFPTMLGPVSYCHLLLKLPGKHQMISPRVKKEVGKRDKTQHR